MSLIPLGWKIIIGLVVVSALAGAIGFFINAVYTRGVSDEKARWEARAAHVSRETQHISGQIIHQNSTTNASISHALTQGSQSIQAISDDQSALVFLTGWRDADKRLCDAADAAGRDRGH